MAVNVLPIFEDTFECRDVNKNGKFFDRVSRLDCLSETYEAELILDINCEIYAIHRGERFTMALSTTLDGQTEKAHYDPKPAGTPSLMDTFEYVMNGKVFKIQEDSKAANKITVIASFGGLIMSLKGDQRFLNELKLDSRIYLLIRKSQ